MEQPPDDREAVRRRMADLRAKAEKRRSLVTTSIDSLTPADTLRLVQELQVYQIELEMQYEELLLAQAERETLHQQYVDLFEFAPVGYCILDALGVVQQLNLRASQLLGTTRGQALGKRLAQFVPVGDERTHFYEFLQRVLGTDTRQTAELEMQRSDGSSFFAVLEGVRLKDERGESRCRLALTDDTARREAVADLGASERKFRALFEESADAALLVHDSVYIDCNQAALDLLGASRREDVVGKSVLLLTPELQPDGVPSARHLAQNVEKARRLGSHRFEWLGHRFTGEEIWLEIVLTPMRVDGEGVLHVVWRDITEQKRLDQRLRESEQRFRTVFEQSTDGMLLLLDGRYVDANAAALRLIGAGRPEQLVGQPADVCTPAVQPNGRRTAEWFAQNVEAARREGSFRCEAQMYRFTGEEIWIEAVLTPIELPGQPLLTHICWRDVTERRRAEQRVQESETRLRTALDAAELGVAQWNFVTDEVFFDARARQLFGLPAEGGLLTFPDVRQILHPDDRERVEASLQRSVAERLPVDMDQRVVWPDGTVRYVVSTGQVHYDAAGRALSMTGVVRDVTDKKLAALHLQESEARLKTALQAADMGIGIWNFDTQLFYVDARARQMFGLPAEGPELSFAELLAVVLPADRELAATGLQRAATGEAPLDVEVRVLHPDGTIRYVCANGQVMHNEQGQPVRMSGVLRDVTESRLAHEELAATNRLLTHILNTTPVVLSRIATDGTLIEVVGAGLRRLSVADNALVGINVFATWPQLVPYVERLLAGEEVQFVGEPPRREGREQTYFQNYGFFDQEKQSAVIFGLDVTEMHQAYARLAADTAFLQGLVSNIQEGILAVDSELRVTEWNYLMEQFLPAKRTDMLGRPIFEALPQLDNEWRRDILRRTLAGETQTFYNIPYSARPGVFDAAFVPLRDAQGTVTGALGVIRDVTERTRLMEEATQARLQREKAVLSAILHTQEDERKRIAEALHNGVGQLLYAAKLHLYNQPIDETQRTAALGLLNEGIKATRTISFELTPNILQDFGLKTALEELCKRIPKQNLHVHLNVGPLPAALPSLLETAVYRIVQELLNNVIKHAQAREAFVYVEPQDQQLHVSVEDDGAGFDVEAAVQKRGGIGLAGVRNRVSLLDGRLDIRSKPGLGTTVTIELPLPAPEADGAAG